MFANELHHQNFRMNGPQENTASTGFLKLVTPLAGMQSAALYRIENQAIQLVASLGKLPLSSWREALQKHSHLLAGPWCIPNLPESLFVADLNSGDSLDRSIAASVVIIPIKKDRSREYIRNTILDELEGVMLFLNSSAQSIDPESRKTFESIEAVAQRILTADAADRNLGGRQDLPAVIENAPAIVFELMARTSGRYEFRYVSPAISQISGLDPDQIIQNPKTLFRCIPEEDRQELFASLEQSLERLEEWSWEGRICPPGTDNDTDAVWIKGLGRPHRRIDRSTIWDGVFVDITKNKNTELTNHRAVIALEKQVNDRSTELLKSQQEVLQRLIEAVSCSHGETGDHIIRMSQYAVEIARELGWSDTDLDMLLQASPLHDIGKIGIPPSLLDKPGDLTKEERKAIQDHCLLGARILQGGSSELVKMAEDIALSHHERWDGTGYPYGLKGEKIPMAARIVSVADVLDALTCTRAYKRAWKLEDSLNEIVECSGTQFDPQVVEALVRALPRIQEIHDALAVKDDSTEQAA